MTTKEKVIIESISRIEKRLKEIRKINEATPLIDLINVKIEARKLLEANKTIEQRTSKEFIAKINALAMKEAKCIKLAKENSGQKMFDLMDEKIQLEFELQELKNEQYYIDRNKR